MKFLYIAVPVILLFALRVGRWYFANRVERPKATIIKQIDNNIEIRKTNSQIYASVKVVANESDAPYKAFNILAWYIFGNNTNKSKIAMTAPVVSQKSNEWEKIAMTAPVISQKSSESEYTVSFIMPSIYTLENLPAPNDSRINIYEVWSKTIAVIKFNNYVTTDRVKKYSQELLDRLKSENISTTGEYTVAQYNDPRTPRFMRTNEIRIEVNL